jgi:hypothetical protein
MGAKGAEYRALSDRQLSAVSGRSPWRLHASNFSLDVGRTVLPQNLELTASLVHWSNIL